MVWITVENRQEHYQQIIGRCVPDSQLEAATANTQLDHLCSLHIGSRAAAVRLSGIICVIGIANRHPKIIEKMIDIGMNIACLNFSHGTEEHHAEVLKTIRITVENYNKKNRIACSLGFAVATKGPIIKTHFPEGLPIVEIVLYEGDVIKLTGDMEHTIQENGTKVVPVNYGNIHNVVQVGNEISINNRRVLLLCIGIENSLIICKVTKGGDVKSRQRVHLPGVPIDLPALSENDISALNFAVEQQVDMIFASYIRSSADVKEIRNVLGENGKNIMIISQIENQQGLNNIDEIIKASDGVMVSRGHLCNEIDEEKVFLAQKSIISKCNSLGKPVICATQMMESMKKKSIPTRAERCDIANAILDGADCILLHHESSLGDYPITCLEKAANICKEAEAAVWQKQLVIDLSNNITPPVVNVHAIAAAAVEISFKLLASAIIVISSSLKSAQLLTQYRPKCPVIAVTRNARKARQAHLFRGIIPLLYKAERVREWSKDLNLRMYYGINFGRKKGFIRSGDPVVVMVCSKQGSGFTDSMKILYVSQELSQGAECFC